MSKGAVAEHSARNTAPERLVMNIRLEDIVLGGGEEDSK